MGVAILCAIFASNTLQRWKSSLKHPVVLGALAWWTIQALSALYAPSIEWKEFSNHSWFYPLLIVSLFQHDDRWRYRAMWSFGIAMSLVLIISWLQFFGVVPQTYAEPAWHNSVFKNYTQQSIQTMAYCAMLGALLVTPQKLIRRHKIYALLGIIIGLASVVIALGSRTTFIALLPLLLFWGIFLLREGSHKYRVAAFIFVILSAVGMAATWHLYPTQRERVLLAYTEAQEAMHTRAPTSIGIRMELWRQSIPIIQDAPILGHGYHQWTPQLLARTNNETNYEIYRSHPHQEYLLIAAEQGLLGLAIYLGLLLALARYISRLPRPWCLFHGSLWVIFVTAGLANCLWVDAVHRHLFVLWLGSIPWLTPSRKSTE